MILTFIGIKNNENCYKLVFLFEMASSKIILLNFGNY
jgi:hypothetical protein